MWASKSRYHCFIWRQLLVLSHYLNNSYLNVNEIIGNTFSECNKYKAFSQKKLNLKMSPANCGLLLSDSINALIDTNAGPVVWYRNLATAQTMDHNAMHQIANTYHTTKLDHIIMDTRKCQIKTGLWIKRSVCQRRCQRRQIQISMKTGLKGSPINKSALKEAMPLLCTADAPLIHWGRCQKGLPFCRWHFQLHFLEWNWLNCD